jgi:hypothetical protein
VGCVLQISEGPKCQNGDRPRSGTKVGRTDHVLVDDGTLSYFLSSTDPRDQNAKMATIREAGRRLDERTMYWLTTECSPIF